MADADPWSPSHWDRPSATGKDRQNMRGQCSRRTHRLAGVPLCPQSVLVPAFQLRGDAHRCGTGRSVPRRDSNCMSHSAFK